MVSELTSGMVLLCVASGLAHGMVSGFSSGMVLVWLVAGFLVWLLAVAWL